MIDNPLTPNVMSTSENKVDKYLENNHYVAKFIDEVNEFIKAYYEKNFPNLLQKLKPVEVIIGKRYIKIVHNNSVWAFISRYEGYLKGSYVRPGDLLKPASWNSPAAHSRGNIVDGTAKYGPYGPAYLK